MITTTTPNFYLVLNTLSQVPEFDISSSNLPWKPCAITVMKSTSSYIINNDTYIKKFAFYFLNNNIICSDELCQSLPYCHPLWVALHLSNTVKENPHNDYVNKHIHPINHYSNWQHAVQHALKKYADDMLISILMGEHETS